METIRFNLYELYKFRDWVIIIEDYNGTSKIQGTAVKEKVFLKNKLDEDGQLEDQLDFNPEDGWLYDINILDKNEIIKYLVYETIVHDDWKKKGSRENEFYDYRIVQKIKLPIIWKKYEYSIFKKPTIQRGKLHSAWSLMVKIRDKKCMICDSTEALHAHHIKSYKDHEELRYDVNNGVTYCKDCHIQWHKENGR